MGDPAGVGPELCLQALANASLREVAVPIVFGDLELLKRVADACALPMPTRVVDTVAGVASCAQPALFHLPGLNAGAVVPGCVDADTGRAAYHYITSAIDAAMENHVAAICTAPIHKEALKKAAISYPGHTEILADRTGADRVCMMLTSPRITVSLVTTHMGLHEVSAQVSKARIRETIDLTAEAMRRMRRHEPRLVVCGLNPHAGEGGLFGRNEETDIILPAVESAKADGFCVEGPLPPDTAFLPGRLETTDAYICMYHDQGLIPLKMLAFDEAVNVTLGLPVVRTSVDHGTALDLAWQGRARPGSLFEAIRLAARLTRPDQDK